MKQLTENQIEFYKSEFAVIEKQRELIRSREARLKQDVLDALELPIEQVVTVNRPPFEGKQMGVSNAFVRHTYGGGLELRLKGPVLKKNGTPSLNFAESTFRLW